jgi:mono/diheme cytochrome c family protein
MNSTGTMKKPSAIIAVFISVITIVSCDDVKRTRGREYMPDMAYSRAYETYTSHEMLAAQGINYNAMPVSGTVKRGEVFPFSIPRDKEGDSVNYVASRQVENPLAALDSIQLKESERLYLINCAICHGTKLDGNGPLYNEGKGPYSAAPRNFIGDPGMIAMPQGQMFYSVTYGKGQMGPYGPQLSTSQRWRIIHYVKTKQREAQGGPAMSPQGGRTDSTSTQQMSTSSTSAASGATTGATSTGGTTSGSNSAAQQK